MSEQQSGAVEQQGSFARSYYGDYVLKETRVNTSRTRQRVAAVLAMLGEKRGKLLSIGSGNLTEPLTFQQAGFDVTIADVADSQFERAREADIEAHLIDLEADEIPGSYDVVSCLEVLEHLVDPLGALRRLTANVRAGGELFVSLPDEFHLVARIQILFGRPPFSRYDWHHLRFFNRRSARKLFADAGLRVVRTAHMPLMPARWAALFQPVGRALAKIAPGLFSLSHVYKLKLSERAP